ncbi:MAG: GH32 C-terminal domain-containing protein [Thermoguttaceae bacterium]
MRHQRNRQPTLLLTILAVMVATSLTHAAENRVIGDKTLVAWVAPADLTQRGGSVLTIEKSGGVFDAIVLGELATSKWMAGSNFHNRSETKQDSSPVETADAKTFVQIAIVYRGKQVTIYRNGAKYADYSVKASERFAADSFVLMGLRHTDAMSSNRFFTGAIDDARIYNVALDAEQIAALKPNVASDPEPYAWWDFEGGRVADRMKGLTTSTLLGDARIADGKLHLDKKGAYLMATKEPPETGIGSIDLSDANSSARALREHLLADPFRPGYHFVIPEGRGMPFDPNGAVYWKGRYHLFYIFQDKRGHNWGHVSSTDLFHWRHHPTRLVAGMFSGNCFINADGRPTMCYHQVGQGNAMAVAIDDDLNEWEKLESNPITPETEEGDPHHGKYSSWDPFGWQEGDTVYAIFGGKRPAIAKAKSLAGPWNYVGDLLANTVGDISINEDVSCADLFKIGNKHMLLCISHRLGCRYYLGDWKNEQFHPTFHEKMSWVDNSYFAPESLLDDQGRRIMWAWIFDNPGFKTRMDYGWSGTMSLPRVLTLGDDGMLRMNPPKEIELLRYNARKAANLEVKADAERVVEGIGGDSLELAVEIRATGAKQFGIKVCCSPDGEEQTLIYYDAVEKQLKVDTNRSSLTEGAKTLEAGPLELATGEPLELRVFIDRSVVEVFANGRQAVMRRIYPSRDDSTQVRLFSNGGPAKVTTLEAWDMMPSNPY